MKVDILQFRDRNIVNVILTVYYCLYAINTLGQQRKNQSNSIHISQKY